MKSEFNIREPKPTDLNFIQSSFLKSMKKESALGRACSTRVFFKEFTKVIDYILDRSEILIACDQSNEDTILGYLIYEPTVVHYAYVKNGLRELNIARDLILHAFPDAKSVVHTQSTNDSKKIAKKYPELIFNPFSLYKKVSND